MNLISIQKNLSWQEEEKKEKGKEQYLMEKIFYLEEVEVEEDTEEEVEQIQKEVEVDEM